MGPRRYFLGALIVDEPLNLKFEQRRAQSTELLYNKRMTIQTTYSQARAQLKALMDSAADDRQVIVIRRRTGGDVAMIAADELDGLIETAQLLRSAKNAERLLGALTRARTESLPPTPIEELEKLIGSDA